MTRDKIGYERVGKADDIGDTCACVLSSKLVVDGLGSIPDPGVFGVFAEWLLTLPMNQDLKIVRINGKFWE